ncbi:hypothetical protein SOVF_191130 [Spinacia oleracea]|nr:hypothetical protein SOVF_191130 [Spinacia oleracea]
MNSTIEKFVSSWSDGKTVPENYVFPTGQRPAEHLYPKSKISVPLIDLGKANGPDRSEVVRQIMDASQNLGAFQVINHGVSIELMDNARDMFKEFFNLPAEEKAKYCSWDTKQKFILYTSKKSSIFGGML